MGKIDKNASWGQHRCPRPEEGGSVCGRDRCLPLLPPDALCDYPEGAARRILREQLNIRDMKLDGPLTFVDTSGTENHWDIGFIYTGTHDLPPRSPAWTSSRFVQPGELKGEEVVRSQIDVLAYAGKRKTQ